MPVQAVPITPESIPTDLFLRRTYEEEGPGAALLLLNQHLDMCEASGASCIEYILSNGQVSRDEFVKSMMQDLENTPADGHITITPFDLNTGEEYSHTRPIMDALENTDDLFALLFESITYGSDQEPHPNVHKEFMIQVYDQYRDVVKQIIDLKTLKEQITTRFIWHVNEWSHQNLNHPNQDPSSIHLYLNTKYNHLKTLLPRYASYRALNKKVKAGDPWVQATQTRDGLSLGGGICNESGVETDEFRDPHELHEADELHDQHEVHAPHEVQSN